MNLYPDAPKGRDTFQEGAEFQDFVIDLLALRYKWTVSVYTSRKYQYKNGESANRFEIKYDRRQTETQRIGIEVAEKSAVSVPVWTPSGILRIDNTVIYVIGNYDQVWLFAKKHLQMWYAKNNPKVYEINGTMKSCYIPFDVAEKLCITKIIVKE